MLANGSDKLKLRCVRRRQGRGLIKFEAEALPSRSAGLPAPAEAQASRVGRKLTRYRPAAKLVPANSQPLMIPHTIRTGAKRP
jgi:hypothetical protein